MTYYPQLKTTTAERTAIRETRDHDHNSIVPILQITKPRITKVDPIDALERHIGRAMDDIHSYRSVIVGITDDETFQDANLNQYILDSSNAFEAWRERLAAIRDQHGKTTVVIPCVVGIPRADILSDYTGQIQRLSRDFGRVAIRIPVVPQDAFDELKEVASRLGLRDLPDENYLLFDYGYVDPDELTAFSNSLVSLDAAISGLNLGGECVPVFSSCPSTWPMRQRVSERIHKVPMIEYEVYSIVRDLKRLSYGDYAFVHPTRLEGGGFWYPRIDYPSRTHNECFYTRYFNKETWRENDKLHVRTTLPNDEAYRRLSRTVVDSDFFINDPVDSWGRKQILANVEQESVTGKSPQYYIAIRSNIHMEHILSMDS